MECGKVIQSDTYENLLIAGTTFKLLVSAHNDTITELNQVNGIKRGSENEVLYNQSEGEISSIKGPIGAQLTEEEEKVIGNVGWKPFWDYINYSKGKFMMCLIILGQSVFLALQTASTFWLAIAIEIPKVTNDVLIGVYALISLSSVVFVYVRSYITALLGLKASTTFFSSFTAAIFNAPMLFFDSTPVGRILTRVSFFYYQYAKKNVYLISFCSFTFSSFVQASSDLSILDFDLPYSITYVASMTIEILVIICIMVSVTWQILIVVVPAMVASIYIQVYPTSGFS